MRDAELKFLRAFPAREHVAKYDPRLGYVLWAHERPKGTNLRTVRRLYEMGLIEHGPIDDYLCPLRLTEAGKRALVEAKGD